MQYTRTVRWVSGAAILLVSSVALGAGSATSGAGGKVQAVNPAAAVRSIVFECFRIDRGPDPRALVRAETKNFGFDTLIVRKVDRMCEPALKLPADTDLGNGTIEMQPNAALALGAPGLGNVVMLEGPLGLLRESPTFPRLGKVLGSQMQGGGMLADSFFDIFIELSVVGDWNGDSFFDITYRIDFPGGPAETRMQLQAQGDGVYTGLLDPAVQIGGVQLTTATLTLHDPSVPGGPAATRVMECFRTERGSDPNDPYSLTTNNFGTDRLVVRQSKHLCEGAIKTKQQVHSGTPLPLQPPNVVWECFALTKVDNVNKSYHLYTQNFGRHPVRVRRAFELCEDARKVRVNAAGQETSVGRPTARVWECFAIEARNQTAVFWLTNRNFGPGAVRVRNPVALCELAIKVPIHAYP